MGLSLMGCTLTTKTIVAHYVSMLTTSDLPPLRRTFLTEAVREKAASPGSEMFTLIEASGEFRLRKTGSDTASAIITTWMRLRGWLRPHERNCLVNSLGRGSRDKIQDRARR